MATMSLKSLQRAVAEKILADTDLSAYLSRENIHWNDPVVGIEDVLLDREPSDTRWFGRSRQIPKKEYTKILDRWKANFVGGKEKWSPDSDEKYWSPSDKDAKLFWLNGNQVGSNQGYVYYLLVLSTGKQIFLCKELGNENRLSVVRKNNGKNCESIILCFRWQLEEMLRDNVLEYLKSLEKS